MKRLKSYFFTNSNLNSRGKYISLKDNAEPNETLFNDLLDSVVKPKVGADYQDQADFNAVNTKDSSKFVTAENLPEVDSSGSLLTITTTAAVDTNLLRRKKYTVSANIPSSISDISSRLTTKLVTPANLPKFALDNSEYTQVASQLPYFAPSVVVTTDGVDFYQTYSLKLRALESTMMTHAGVRLDTVLDGLRTDVNACVSDSELASAVNSLNLAINNKANKVSPNFVAGYNGTKVTVNSQGIVTTVTKASASDITNDSSVSGSTVKDALNWLKANGGGVGGASDTDGVTNLSDVPGGTATDALNNLLDSLSHYFVKDVVGKTNGDTLEVDKINVLTLSSDTSFTLPTPSLAYKGKVLIIVQGNGGVNRAEIFGGLQGSVIISDLSDILIYNCVYDIGGGGNWVLISRDDSKMCQIPVIVESSTHYASANENIKADALSFGANQSVVIPASNSEGRMIYVYYPTGAPTAFVVNLTGGYTATLNQGDWFLLRDNGSFWEAIGTSQNTVDLSPYATIDSPTFTGIPAGPTASPGTNTTQLATTAFVTTAIGAIPSYLGTANRITVSAGVIDISSAYVGQSSITTVGTLTSGALGSGFTAIADAYIASAATWNGKFNTPTGLTTNYISKWNGSTFVDSLILSRAGGLTLQNSTVIDLNTEGKSYFEFYPLLRNTVGTPRFALDLFPETSTQFAGFVSAVINITSGGDVVSGKNTVMNGITATHRSTDGTNGNRPFLNINAIMLRPNISANSASASGVHHITSQNADNYSSIVQDGASGFNPINYSAYSLRANAIGFSHVKNVVANSGVQSRHNFNQLATTQTTWSNGFGFDIRNTLANSNASPQIVNFTEEYIIQNQGAGTVHAGKRYRYEAGNQSAASAHIMGLYRTGVIIGDTTALPNALCSLDLDSATTGLGLNRVAGDLGTTRNGLIWYDTVGNLFKGVQNGSVVSLLTGSGLTTNTIPRANAGALQDSYITEITTNAGGSVGATRPYPLVATDPSGTGSFSGYLKWVDNGSSIARLFIYKPYTNGQGAGWYQILDTQNPSFPALATSSPAIGMGLSTMSNSTSTAPTNSFTGEIRNLRVGSTLYGLGVFQSGAGFHYLKPYGGNQWEFTVAVNSYMRDWDWEVIGATANSGKGGGSNTLSNLSKIGNSTVKFRAMANTNSPYYYIEGVFKVNSSGAITSLVITQPSSNTTAFNVSITDTRIQFTGNAFSLAYVICEKIAGQYYGNLYTTSYENERYSSDATVKYWVGNFALGSSTINGLTQLDLQSTTKGLGLNLVAGDLGTGRNGLMWYDTTNHLFKGTQNGNTATFATTLNTNLTVQFGWKYTYTANTSLFQMLNDTGSTKWIAVDACSIYALTLNFGTAPTLAYKVFYNKNGTGWEAFNTIDIAANTHDVGIKPSSTITLAANDTIQFRLNQGADGVSMNVIIKS